MTNHWKDIKNTDVVLVMGANPAENHPCGFKWALEARDNRGAKLVTIDPRILSDYVGIYSLNPDMKLTIKNDNDQLFVMASGQPFFPVYPTGRDEFAFKVADAQISFVRNQQGKVDRLVLHQDGLDQEALKTN